MMAPAPKTDEEIYREKRIRIRQAASDEWRRLGKNPPTTAQICQDVVREALRAL
jgi:hypothetical protein